MGSDRFWGDHIRWVHAAFALYGGFFLLCRMVICEKMVKSIIGGCLQFHNTKFNRNEKDPSTFDRV